MVDRILIVEDELAQRQALVQYLARAGYAVEAVATGEAASEELACASFSVLITDLRLPGMDGLTLIRRARELDEEMGLLLVTAYATVDSAVEALRVGAHDYLLKPLILEEVARKVQGLIRHRDLVRENARLRRALQAQHDPDDIVAVSQAMRDVMAWVKRAASTRSTTLITGETGTGKELVARAIHQASADRDSPFLAVNIAAIPDNMVESELFGHERGAFTGAERRREGLLRAAAGGTVFLDEVADLSLPAQAKLLRAVEAREVQPLGSDAAAPFRARIVAATHRKIEDMVARGSFRDDLYYRLNIIRIQVPSLAERPEDIPVLVPHLLQRHASRSGQVVPVVSAEAMRALCGHSFRGNIRELSNVLERALILADAGRIDIEQLPSDVREFARPSLTLHDALCRAERSHIAMVLRLCDGNRERAAAEMGISPATLYRRLDRLQLKLTADKQSA